jgi:ribosomal protein L11 methyltransferase
MRYIEVTVNTPAEELDKRCEELAAMGAGGFVIENEEDFKDFLAHNRQYWDYVDEALEKQFLGVSRIKCYLTDDEQGLAVLRKFREAYPELSTAFVEDSDWENNWREYYKPINIGEKLVVVPEWEQAPDNGRIPLWLDPGLIFGTGSHPTTRLCLSALERYAGPGKKVLDLGCGSGILGIGTLLLGCERCLGVDIDPKAPDVVMSNSALNGIGPDRMTAWAGDILSDKGLRARIGGGWDLVLANIVADVIIPLSAGVQEFMAPDGIFICSGIIENRWVETADALTANGFEILEHRSEDEWHFFACRIRH